MSSTVENLLPLEDIGTRECALWRDRIFERFGVFRDYLIKAYRAIATQEGYVAANRWLELRSSRRKLGGTGLNIDEDYEVVTDYARTKAKVAEKLIHDTCRKHGEDYMLKFMRKAVERLGIKFPLDPEKEHDKNKRLGALARICDESWWRRKILVWQRRELEAFARELGLVSSKRGAYISNISLSRFVTRKKDNRKLLERLQAENELGQTYTLAELSDLSTSNPEIRRTELMVRMRGFEELAQDSGRYSGIFYTLTCPSKYHATLKHGKANPKYNGTTPLEAHDYLNTVWQRTRAAWKRAGIEAFGMRVVEPHHDGTPHWHLLLFFESQYADKATDILQRYALEEDGDEAGAAEHRLEVVTIDPEKGSATGYIAKYISKNINGYGIDADLYGLDAKDSAQRIEAWASVWGIRQFQQIGGASVTVWRELRRLNAETIDIELLAELISAADNAEWDKFNELMGGAICALDSRPVRPMYLPKQELNRYGEVIHELKGILHNTSKIVTRIHSWVISLIEEKAEPARKIEPAAESLLLCAKTRFGFEPPDRANLDLCQ